MYYGKYLDPKVDLVFKKIFGQHPNLVRSLLNALLPLPADAFIEDIEYLTPEMYPERHGERFSIVDVRCRDRRGRQFLVEMQTYASRVFFDRVLMNTCKAYATQLRKGEGFNQLRPVYSLNIVNERMTDYPGEYRQDWCFANRRHPGDVSDSLSLTFIELPNYRWADRGHRKLADLWLLFLTQVNEETREVPAELSEHAEIGQALDIAQRAAFTPEEMLAYDHIQDELRLEPSYREEFYQKGLAEGREEGVKAGIQEGQLSAKLSAARAMLADGLPPRQVAGYTGLSEGEVEQLAAGGK